MGIGQPFVYEYPPNIKPDHWGRNQNIIWLELKKLNWHLLGFWIAFFLLETCWQMFGYLNHCCNFIILGRWKAESTQKLHSSYYKDKMMTKGSESFVRTNLIKGHLTSKLNSKTIPVIPSFIFPFHLLPSPVHPSIFSFCFFPGCLAIFILLSSNNNNVGMISVTASPMGDEMNRQKEPQDRGN